MLRWLTILFGAPLLSTGAFLTPQTVTLTQPVLETDDDERTDLYGNDIMPAVAKYSLDATGSVYEIHSPQTEIPHLASPKS